MAPKLAQWRPLAAGASTSGEHICIAARRIGAPTKQQLVLSGGSLNSDSPRLLSNKCGPLLIGLMRVSLFVPLGPNLRPADWGLQLAPCKGGHLEGAEIARM